MAGPVADRLALMTATEANLEPIYLVYDGGGRGLRSSSPDVDGSEPLAHDDARRTASGTGCGRSPIARALARSPPIWPTGGRSSPTGTTATRPTASCSSGCARERGPGPWDRGLTLLVDSTSYGPQVHAIHRVVPGWPLVGR